MRLWQKAMIGLARSERVAAWVQGAACMGRFSRMFVGGGDADAAVGRAMELKAGGMTASLFYLGEYVRDPELIRRNAAELEAMAPKLADAGLDLHLSVDPTQVGAMLSWEVCRENVTALAQSVAGLGGAGRSVVMLDMEDSSVTERTFGLYHELRAKGLPVAVTIQSSLHRSREDLDRLVEDGAMVRLVKGAFAEGPEVAATGRAARDKSYRDGLEQLFSARARERGVYPVLGTHDHRMVAHGATLAARHDWRPDQWEVEMLLGVRPVYQRQLVDQGVAVRLYLPFGESWFPYAIRRVGERPANAWFVLRSMLDGLAG
ncbi:proline dehydrogenase [Pseudodesulfovibrio sp. F-1]|uniref:Proline dehydrogenase n=1 Tax=Pseudodesulfovibrio alkaliphilus TaxID=2661613 RepID=A0A7K1KNY2_9BACT|nr:proline dehydrogenase family protein [Pseudodesulfovibrio alkaliphilus]MUM77806.1 proline dehydrogenase [Pseudodesulfovibrio alkaliphilus]